MPNCAHNAEKLVILALLDGLKGLAPIKAKVQSCASWFLAKLPTVMRYKRDRRARGCIPL